MAIFLVASNVIGALCGTYVVYKLARIAFVKEKKIK